MYEELLQALRLGDAKTVMELASELFVTREKKLNRVEANAFASYANCKIEAQVATIYKYRSYVGTITYNGSVYTFS